MVLKILQNSFMFIIIWKRVASKNNLTSPRLIMSNVEQNPTMIGEIRNLWYQMFLSTLISSVVLHSIGSLILYIRLRSHHYAKWLALIVQIAGFITPIFLGSITNALIAAILVFSGRYTLSFYIAVSIGLGQTICVVAVEFLRIMQTL